MVEKAWEINVLCPQKQIKFKHMCNNEVKRCFAHLFADSPWCLLLRSRIAEWPLRNHVAHHT